MKCNYHAHTTYCQHASMSVEELTEIAIKHGYSIFGISEHMYAPNYHNQWSLKTKERMLSYIAEVNLIKEKYRKQINLLCGFELDVVDSQTGATLRDFNLGVSQQVGVDFSLLALHYFYDGNHVFHTPLNQRRSKAMIKSLKTMFETNVFKYLAHPDAFMEGHQVWDQLAFETSKAMLELAYKHEIVLGFNINGLATKRFYPNENFWKLAAKIGNKVKIELDAHSEEIFDHDYLQRAKSLVKEYNLSVVDEIKWR